MHVGSMPVTIAVVAGVLAILFILRAVGQSKHNSEQMLSAYARLLDDSRQQRASSSGQRAENSGHRHPAPDGAANSDGEGE